jgi:hypothetical protein
MGGEEELPEITLKVGKLSLTTGTASYHVVLPTKDGRDTVYTVAMITPTREGCDLRTIGRRPWEADVPANAIFAFCHRAMQLIDDLMESEHQA